MPPAAPLFQFMLTNGLSVSSTAYDRQQLAGGYLYLASGQLARR
jgi:hypothetical protein